MGERLREHENKHGLVLPWTGLSITLFTITLAAVGTLAVVVSVQNVDTLSTIALALAVLAFAAQLIVSLAQSSAAAQQLAQVERVNSNTQAALAEIRATSNSLLSNQRELFAEVLQAALRDTIPEVAKEVSESATGEGVELNGENLSVNVDIEDLERRIASSLERALRVTLPPVVDSHFRYENPRSVDAMRKWALVSGDSKDRLSPQDVKRAADAFDELTSVEIERLSRMFKRFFENRAEPLDSIKRAYRVPPSGLHADWVSLLDKGFVEVGGMRSSSELPADLAGQYVPIRATEKGVLAMRLIVALGAA